MGDPSKPLIGGLWHVNKNQVVIEIAHTSHKDLRLTLSARDAYELSIYWKEVRALIDDLNKKKTANEKAPGSISSL